MVKYDNIPGFPGYITLVKGEDFGLIVKTGNEKIKAPS